MCLSCGYEGDELQGPLSAIRYRCPSCQTDLYARPPRSYAQMEGLPTRARIGEGVRIEVWADRLIALERERRKSRRWAATVFGLITGAALGAVIIGAAALLA